MNGADPTAQPVGDCTIDSGDPTNPGYCALSSGYATVGAQTAATFETLMNFPLDASTGGAPLSYPSTPAAIFADSEVLSASLSFDVAGLSGPEVGFQVLPLKDSFCSQPSGTGCNSGGAADFTASWNNAWTGAAWSSPGGDYATNADSSPVIAGTGYISGPGQTSVGITALVQSWVDGSYPQGGSNHPPALMLKPTTTGSQANLYRFNSANPASINIVYVPRLGSDPGSTIQSTTLAGKTTLGINVANGNVQLSNKELEVAGVAGHDVETSSTYNSLQGGASDGWTLDQQPTLSAAPGGDALSLAQPDGSVDVWNETSATTWGAGSGIYTPPPGTLGSLCKVELGQLQPTETSWTDASGNQEFWVFYPGADGQVHMLFWNGFWTGSTIGGTFIAPNSSPTALTDSNGYVHVFYIGADGLLHQLASTQAHGTNFAPFLPTTFATAAPNTSPSAFLDVGGVMHVAFLSQGGWLSQWFGPASGTDDNGGAGTVQQIGGQAAPNSSPAAVDNGGQSVFYIDSSGAIHSLYWTSSGWSNTTLGGNAAPNTSPAVATGPNSDLHVAYIDAAGYLSSWDNPNQQNGGSWGDGQPLGYSNYPQGPEPAAAPNSSPSVVVDSFDNTHYSFASNTGTPWSRDTTGGPYGPATVAPLGGTVPPGGSVAANTSTLSTLGAGAFYIGANSAVFQNTNGAYGDVTAGGGAATTGATCKPANPAATYELTYYNSGERLDFNAAGQLIADYNRYGTQSQDELQYSYPGGAARWSVTDTMGRQYTSTLTGTSQLGVGMSDSYVTPSRSYSYAVTSGLAPTAYKDMAGNSWAYSYNGAGQLSQVTDPDGHVTKITYPAAPSPAWLRVNVTRVTSQPGPGGGDTTSYTFYAGGGPAPAGTLAQGETCGTDGGSEIAYGYTVIQYPQSGRWAMDCYDTHDRVYDSIDAYGQPTQTTYNPDDEITSVVDPTNIDENKATPGSASSYDQCFRLKSSSDGQPNAGGATTSYAYLAPNPSSCAGLAPTDFQAQTVSAPAGTPGSNGATQSNISYAYDPTTGVLQSETDALASQNTARFSYNAYGQMVSSTTPDGQTTSYCYSNNAQNGCQNSWGNLVTVTPPAPLAPVSYGYDGDSRMTSTTDGNNNTTTYTYNGNDQVSQQSDQAGKSVTNTYDADGNLLKSVDSAAALNGTTSYIYDAKNRLVFESDPGAGGQPGSSTTYGYDGDNNLTSVFGGAKINPTSATASLAAGTNFAVELAANGGVYAWGLNASGQLGDASTTNTSTPVPVTGLPSSTLSAVAAGDQHAVALASDGSVWSWGANSFGQLGNNSTTGSTTAVRVQNSSLTDATAIAAGGEHSMALQSGGTVWGWGANTFGQLGDGTRTSRQVPVQVSGLIGATGIAAGFYHSLAITSTGGVEAWGYNGYGELGNGNTSTQTTPVATAGLSHVVALAAGEYHSLALESNGTVWAWGENNDGQLGLGNTNNQSTPQQVTALSGVNIVAIAAGAYESLALASNGKVYAWGYNSTGQLGNGNTTTENAPVAVSAPVESPGGFSAIAAGANDGLFATTEGVPMVAGDNTDGQLGSGLSVTCGTPATPCPIEIAGGEVQYSYNNDDLPASVQEPDASAPITLTYDPDQRLICTSYPNNMVVQNLYDQYNDLVDIQAAHYALFKGNPSCGTTSTTGTPTGGTVFSNYAYTYTYASNGANTNLRQTETIGGTSGGIPWAYYYDALNRLTEATTGSTTLTYGYDGDGNILSRVQNGAGTYQTYNGADELCGQSTSTQTSCPSPATYTFDGAGNEVSAPDLTSPFTLNYNSREQTSAITPSGASTQPLSYQGFGQTGLQEIGAAPTRGGQAPVLENNTMGVSASEAATASGSNVPITYYTRAPGGGLLSERLPAGSSDYYVPDANGSIIALTSNTGAIAGTYTYDPYGQTTSSSAPSGFGFDSGYLMPSGLYHFGARYYDPSTGRWTQPDPAYDPSNLALGNSYSFGNDNPPNNTDNNGRFTVSCAFGVLSFACHVDFARWSTDFIAWLWKDASDVAAAGGATVSFVGCLKLADAPWAAALCGAAFAIGLRHIGPVAVAAEKAGGCLSIEDYTQAIPPDSGVRVHVDTGAGCQTGGVPF